MKVYWAAAAACFAYYVWIGVSARFGLDMSWMWLAAGGALALAGFACLAPLPGWMRAAWRTLLCAGLALLAALLGLVISGMRGTPPADLDYLIVLAARASRRTARPAPRCATGWTRRSNIWPPTLRRSPSPPADRARTNRSARPSASATRWSRRASARERILLEDRSTSTAENLAFSLALLDSPDASVGVVTNNFHVYRATRLAERAGYKNVFGVAASYTGPTLPHFMAREAACLVADWALGNL